MKKKRGPNAEPLVAAEEKFMRGVQQALQQLLREKCVSQSELARRLGGCSRQHVGAVLHGKHIVHMRTLVRILTVLGDDVGVALEEGSLVIRSRPGTLPDLHEDGGAP